MSQYCFFIAASWGDAAVPKHFKALAHRLVERGHRVVYLPHGQQVSIDDGDFHVRSFPSPRPTKSRDFLFLHRLVREYQPDCMIANFGAVNIVNIVAWLNRVPCRIDWYHSLSKAFELDKSVSELKWASLVLRKRLVYKFASTIVAVSEATRDDLIAVYNVDKNKTLVFYNNLPDPLRHFQISDEKESHPVVVTCVGGFFQWKGQDILIEATKKVREQSPRVRVELIGDGPLYSKFANLIQSNDLNHCCTLLGKLDYSLIPEKMRRSYAVIVPSRQDSFPYVVLEAMAVGTPVIASRVGGIPEAIRDGVDGFLVPPGDPEALAEKIKVLLLNPALREQMGKSARQRFLDMFEQTRNVEQQALWFEELVQQHRS